MTSTVEKNKTKKNVCIVLNVQPCPLVSDFAHPNLVQKFDDLFLRFKRSISIHYVQNNSTFNDHKVSLVDIINNLEFKIRKNHCNTNSSRP